MTNEQQPDRKPPRLSKWHVRFSRDAILFVFGLCGIAHETLIHAGPERPTLLLIFAAAAGLPIVLRGDERK